MPKSPIPYSLGKPIEWKLDIFLSCQHLNHGVPYSLGKPIEWKLPDRDRAVLIFCHNSLLAREANWMETRKIHLPGKPARDRAIPFARETNWMETRTQARLERPEQQIPYSLGKPIEWKLYYFDTKVRDDHNFSLLARETNWMETNQVSSTAKPDQGFPYSLGKPIEWKLLRLFLGSWLAGFIFPTR